MISQLSPEQFAAAAASALGSCSCERVDHVHVPFNFLNSTIRVGESIVKPNVVLCYKSLDGT